MERAQAAQLGRGRGWDWKSRVLVAVMVEVVQVVQTPSATAKRRKRYCSVLELQNGAPNGCNRHSRELQ